jgi:serine/threonine-protein kinase
VVALAIALAAGIGAYWFGWARYTATPGVYGMTQKAATAKLDRAGFDVTVGDPAYSETVPKGHVVATDPAAGSRVLDHGTITITVSRGKERYAVPKLRGRTVDQAQDALLAQHLTYGRSVMRWSERVPKGQVITSTPPAGTREPRSTAVDLVVSRGPAPIRVRDWTGQDAARAERVIKAQGLQVDASDQEYSDSVPQGRVISQDPTSGILHRGDTVRLVVSRGPQLVEVPGDLRAMGVDAATQLLESLGFKVRVEKSDYYIGVGYVYSSDPSPGSMAPKGSTVVLRVI